MCDSQHFIYDTQGANGTSVELVPFLLWSDTEMWFVIILGSVPPLRPLFERVVLRKVRPISGAVGFGASKSPSSRTPQTIGSMGKRAAGLHGTELTVMVMDDDERGILE